MNDLIQAQLVYDGGDTVHIPPQMGAPRADQMQGTPAEQLCELAGRVCYDSLGKGRPSFTVPHNDDAPHGNEVEGYHDHIAKVGHGSVWEHFNFTMALPHSFEHWKRQIHFFPSLLNRPGLFVGIIGQSVHLTMNLRTAAEWDNFGYEFGAYNTSSGLGDIIRAEASRLAPHIVKADGTDRAAAEIAPMVAEPVIDEERWVSLFISGSRGLSHELVRHGDFTAISQRSTRFVDESDSSWVQHPLLTQYAAEQGADGNPDIIEICQGFYEAAVEHLEPWLISRGIDKTSARKQARGAARGYLGNALYTELIFSASVAQWKRILRQRASVFADAEIREMACKALLALKSSRYGSSFDGWELKPSPDGIGQVVVEQV